MKRKLNIDYIYNRISSLLIIADVSALLPENGNVYSWGSGTDGQLGHGDEQTFLSKPMGLAEHFSCRVCQVAASDSLSAALTGLFLDMLVKGL